MPHKHYLYIIFCFILSLAYAYFVDTKAFLNKVVEMLVRFIAGSSITLLAIEILDLTEHKFIVLIAVASTLAIDKLIQWFIKFVENSLKAIKSFKDLKNLKK